MAEISIGIVCGCLPVLPQLVRQYKLRASPLFPDLKIPNPGKFVARPVTASSSKSMTTWHDQENSPQLKSKYVKLDERRLPLRPISITESLRNLSYQALIPQGEGGPPTARWDLEEGGPLAGARQAQRFKMYAQDLPAVHHGDGIPRHL